MDNLISKFRVKVFSLGDLVLVKPFYHSLVLSQMAMMVSMTQIVALTKAQTPVAASPEIMKSRKRAMENRSMMKATANDDEFFDEVHEIHQTVDIFISKCDVERSLRVDRKPRSGHETDGQISQPIYW